MRLGEKIRILRVNKGWTQAQLAKKLCLSESTIQKWEKGKNTPPLDALKDIAGLFLVHPGELVDENKEFHEFIFLYEKEISSKCQRKDSPHKVYDAHLEDGAKLHRFSIHGSIPYSAIYQESKERCSCERERELNMIRDWNAMKRIERYQKGLYEYLGW